MAGTKGTKTDASQGGDTAPLNEPLVREVRQRRLSQGRSGLTGHHCDVCGKSNLKSCKRKGHILTCEKHPGTWYSRYHSCVLCWEEQKREAARQDKEKAAQRAGWASGKTG